MEVDFAHLDKDNVKFCYFPFRYSDQSREWKRKQNLHSTLFDVIVQEFDTQCNMSTILFVQLFNHTLVHIKAKICLKDKKQNKYISSLLNFYSKYTNKKKFQISYFLSSFVF